MGKKRPILALRNYAMPPYIAMNYKTLHYNALQSIHYNTLQCIKMHYNTLQYITKHYNTLQYIKTQYKTIKHYPSRNLTSPKYPGDVMFWSQGYYISMSCECQSVDTLGRTGDVHLRHPFQTLLVHRGVVV